MAHRIRPSIDAVESWLAGRYREPVTNLVPLGGGYWSAAYGYRVGTEALVLRLSDTPEGFVIDRAAMRFACPELPVPEVLEIGDALGLKFAISRRHWGRFLETVSVDEAPRAGRALNELLSALRTTPSEPDGSLVWHSESSAKVMWRASRQRVARETSIRPAHGPTLCRVRGAGQLALGGVPRATRPGPRRLAAPERVALERCLQSHRSLLLEMFGSRRLSLRCGLVHLLGRRLAPRHRGA